MWYSTMGDVFMDKLKSWSKNKDAMEKRKKSTLFSAGKKAEVAKKGYEKAIINAAVKATKAAYSATPDASGKAAREAKSSNPPKYIKSAIRDAIVDSTVAASEVRYKPPIKSSDVSSSASSKHELKDYSPADMIRDAVVNSTTSAAEHLYSDTLKKSTAPSLVPSEKNNPLPLDRKRKLPPSNTDGIENKRMKVLTIEDVSGEDDDDDDSDESISSIDDAEEFTVTLPSEEKPRSKSLSPTHFIEQPKENRPWKRTWSSDDITGDYYPKQISSGRSTILDYGNQNYMVCSIHKIKEFDKRI